MIGMSRCAADSALKAKIAPLSFDLFCRRCWRHKANPQHHIIAPNNFTRLGCLILHEKLKYCGESVGALDHQACTETREVADRALDFAAVEKNLPGSNTNTRGTLRRSPMTFSPTEIVA